KMNGHMMNNSKTGDWDYLADEKLWASVPDFQYEPAEYSTVIHQNASNLITLLAWLLLSFAALYGAVTRMKTV
ncbi:MAG: hypothetical protein ACKO96_10930, partial [Flammeovirgaceae bacterium]